MGDSDRDTLTRTVPDDKIDGNIVIKLEGVNLPVDDVDRTELELDLEEEILRKLRREFNAPEDTEDDIEARRAISRRDTHVVVRLYDVAPEPGVNSSFGNTKSE